jgi:hypothetical protein
MTMDTPSVRPGSGRILTPTVWLNAAHVEHWLRSIWSSWRYDEIREQWDDHGRWFWIIPDYQRGRSRILGIEAEFLEEVTVTRLKRILEEANWLQRIESEDLIVTRDESGRFCVETWRPEVDEAWFTDPHAGNYVAYRSEGRGITNSLYPAALPEKFLVLHGEKWSAMGPRDPRAPKDYTAEELGKYVPSNLPAER